MRAPALFDLARWTQRIDRLVRDVTDADRAWANEARGETRKSHRLARRALLRRVLARYTGIPAAHVPLVHDAAGRPTLRDLGDVHVSTSHSGDLLAIAVANAPIGVDVERLRPLPDWRALAGDHFTPREAARIAALPEAAVASATLRLWTMKEAATKALGVGLPEGLPYIALPCEALLSDGRWGQGGTWRARLTPGGVHRGGHHASCEVCIDGRALRIDARRIRHRGTVCFLATVSQVG